MDKEDGLGSNQLRDTDALGTDALHIAAEFYLNVLVVRAFVVDLLTFSILSFPPGESVCEALDAFLRPPRPLRITSGAVPTETGEAAKTLAIEQDARREHLPVCAYG